MNSLKALYYISLCAVMVFFSISCNSKNNMDRSIRTKFSWTPTVAAPRNYPIEMKYGFVGFGEQGKYPILDNIVGDGIATPGSEVDINGFDNDKGHSMPKSINALWLSYAERKYYKAEIKLEEGLQTQMLTLFREGFLEHTHKRWNTYNSFVVTLLPKGKIWLFLASADRTVLVCDSLQANEVQVRLQDFEVDAYEAYGTTEKLCEEALKYHENSAAQLKKYGIPEELWQRYADRFCYEIRILAEDKRANVDPGAIYYYTNGETRFSNDSVPIYPAARLQKMECEWCVADTIYTAHFYFDEKEIMDAYPKSFGLDGRGKGVLEVKISKYNNRFDIILRVGEKEYPLTKTKIHAFLSTPKNETKENYPYYNNHEETHSSEIHFIGE